MLTKIPDSGAKNGLMSIDISQRVAVSPLSGLIYL